RDHLLLGHPHHLGVLVIAAALRLVGHHLEADQVVQELFLLVDGGVARADERGLLVDALLDVADGDHGVVHLCDHLGQLRVVLGWLVLCRFAAGAEESGAGQGQKNSRGMPMGCSHSAEITRLGRQIQRGGPGYAWLMRWACIEKWKTAFTMVMAADDISSAPVVPISKAPISLSVSQSNTVLMMKGMNR